MVATTVANIKMLAAAVGLTCFSVTTGVVAHKPIKHFVNHYVMHKKEVTRTPRTEPIVVRRSEPCEPSGGLGVGGGLGTGFVPLQSGPGHEFPFGPASNPPSGGGLFPIGSPPEGGGGGGYYPPVTPPVVPPVTPPVPPTSSAPEPETWALLGIGFTSLGVAARLRNKRISA